MPDLANFIGTHLVRYDSPRVCCPPGRIEPREGPLVVVATVMRAGTHLMIDALLNNFDALRASPLYVNLDELLGCPGPAEQVDRLTASGGYVIKTHYPQVEARPRPDREALVRRVAQASRIIIVRRDPAETFRSTQSWLRAADSARNPVNMSSMSSARDWETYRDALDRFDAFWSEFPALRVEYRRLIDPDALPAILDEVADWIGLPRRRGIVACLPKDAKRRVYLAKALTRMLGRRAPLINTGIRFAKP